MRTCSSGLYISSTLSVWMLVANTAQAEAPAELGEISVVGSPQAQPAQGALLPVTVITADELRAWGAADLADVLSLVAGTTPARGGDAGPAGLMPGLVGAREADDYLLVVDGIPLGSTTTPPFESITLAGVERIEVRRGPDAAIYGSAAFAGAIYIYHYAAGKSPDHADLRLGSYGSRDADITAALPSLGPLDQSFIATVSYPGYSDPRARAERYQLLYRASSQAGPGVLGLDAGYLDLQQVPFSPTPVTDQGLSNDVPVDSNQNPAGARINEYRSQLSLDYMLPWAGGNWDTKFSLTYVANPVVQGFLTDGPDHDGGDTNAAGYSQYKYLNEAYFDSHWTRDWNPDLNLTLGANEMYGYGEAYSTAFQYIAPLPNGTPLADLEVPDGASYAADTRAFFGVYALSHWRFTPTFSLDLGLRKSVDNENRRTNSSADDSGDASDQIQRNMRLSSSATLRWQALAEGGITLSPYLAYANAFQPSQFDFSPDPDNAAFLQPETARSWQLGVRGTYGILDWELSTARVDFGNAVVTTEVRGLPTFVNGGSDSYRDVDLDLELHLSTDLRFRFSYEYVDARYRDYNFVDDNGANLQLGGNRLPLTPISTASAGLVYGESAGFNGAVSAEYQGRRYLDPQNQLPATAFISYDGKLGYGFGAWTVYLSGENLTNRRDPVIASEIGDGQVYRLLGRRFELGLGWDF